MTEIIFEVTEDEVDSGYSASALGHGIHTQGNSVEEIRSNVKAYSFSEVALLSD